MRSTKAGLILSKLNATEINWLAKTLENEFNPKRRRLFTLLQQADITKPVLYKKLFNATYTKEKDYLLRNELFKLTEWIENTLVAKAHAEALESDRWLKMNLQMNLYGRLRLYDEAENIYHQLQAQLEQANLYAKALNNFFDYLPYVVSGGVQNKMRAKKLTPLIEKGLSYFYKSTTVQYQNVRSSEAFLKYFSKQVGAESEDICGDDAVITIDLELHKTNLSEFLYRYARCFSNLGSADLKMEEPLAAEKAISPLISLDAKHKSYYINILQMIAVQYSVHGEFENADGYFRRGLEIVPRHADMFQSLLMNHTTNLVKLKKYAEAAELLERESAFLIERLPMIATIINQRLIACYIYLKQTDKLYKILNADFDQLEPYLRMYYRLSYCVLLLTKKDYEAAWREISNIQRSKLNAGVEPGYVLIADFFYETISHIHHYQTMSRLPAGAIKKIHASAKPIDAMQFTNYNHIMPYVWLKEAVGG